jgi:hypothetical protein
MDERPEVERERGHRDRSRGTGVVRARRPLHLVLVTWRDAWFDFERDPSGWRDEYLVKTVGFLVREEPGSSRSLRSCCPDATGSGRSPTSPAG